MGHTMWRTANMMRKTIELTPRGRGSPEGPCWQAARAWGCDMSLLEHNLKLTPDQRIRNHQRALRTVVLLRQAMEKHHAGH